MDIGKLQLYKSPGMPYAGFGLFVPKHHGPSTKEIENLDELDFIFPSEGEAGNLWQAAGVIISELKHGRNVYFVINENDDFDDYGIDGLIILREGDENGDY